MEQNPDEWETEDSHKPSEDGDLDYGEEQQPNPIITKMMLDFMKRSR